MAIRIQPVHSLAVIIVWWWSCEEVIDSHSKEFSLMKNHQH